MVKVQVLLSAYNGERYIREQIESLLNQAGVSVRIRIRDDGSVDSTREILREYESRENVDIVCGENIGVTASFFELLKASGEPCDYYAFSDQDDVWKEDKLSRAVRLLSAEDGSLPLLYTSCLDIVDESLNPVSRWEKPGRDASFYNAMVQNVSVGNTQVFNGALRDLLIQAENYENIYLHDHFTYLAATAFGKVIFDGESHILYRQHGQNAVGMNGGARFAREKAKSVFAGKIRRNARQLQYFLGLYGPAIKPEHRAEALKYLGPGNVFKRLRYLFVKKAYCQTPLYGTAFWLLYLFGFLSVKEP
jgi:glycosyltransferase involved in cell wall biosynthesis